MAEKFEIEPYDCVQVPRTRVAEFIHEPFSALWDAADREQFTKSAHTTEINCDDDHALLRSCRWTDKPIVLKQRF